jgi:hypothetical protein
MDGRIEGDNVFFDSAIEPHSYRVFMAKYAYTSYLNIYL